MEEYEKKCYMFILNLAKELAEDYDTKYQPADKVL